MTTTFDYYRVQGASSDDPASETFVWVAAGYTSRTSVYAAALLNCPESAITSVGTLYRQSISIRHGGHDVWYVDTVYGKQDKSVGSVSFSFDTTGGTIRIYHAKEHVLTYDSDGNQTNDDNWSGAINVKPGGKIEGTEVVIPALRMTYTVKHNQGIVNESFAKAFASITGKVNNDDFRQFEAGELLFLGASGTGAPGTEGEVAYHFAASANAEGLTIAGVAGIDKLGTEFLWVEYEDDEKNEEGGDTVAGLSVKGLHLERIYDQVAFNSVFSW